MISAVEGGAAAPATAADDLAGAFDDEVGAIRDELGVDAHEVEASLDLSLREEVSHQAGHGCPDQHGDSGDVVFDGYAGVQHTLMVDGSAAG